MTEGILRTKYLKVEGWLIPTFSLKKLALPDVIRKQRDQKAATKSKMLSKVIMGARCHLTQKKIEEH